MTWIAPEANRTDPPSISDERTMLEAWLEFHRATLLRKCAGLTGDQLVLRAAPPSTLSLLGLIRHMTDVERGWFRRRLAGEAIEALYWTDASPDGDFDLVDPGRAEADFATYTAEVDAARRAASRAGLDDTFTHPRGEVISLRWVLCHMIEEYARHNGHADLLREATDGATGQ